MDILIGSTLGLLVLALIVGAVTGRVRLSACCSIVDPRRDLRMRGAFEDDAATDVTSGSADGDRPSLRPA